MTEKQKRFADYYIELGNATEATRKAGYKTKYPDKIASQLLGNTRVKEYIDKKIKSKDNKRIASQDEVLQYFTKVMRGESFAEIVVVQGEGDGISKAVKIQKKPDERERLDAAKQLAKRYGLDKLVIEHEEKIQVIDDV